MSRAIGGRGTYKMPTDKIVEISVSLKMAARMVRAMYDVPAEVGDVDLLHAYERTPDAT